MATVRISDVPDDVLRTLQERAEVCGVSLAGYACELLRHAVSRPSPAELTARIAVRGVVVPIEPTQDTVRALRGGAE